MRTSERLRKLRDWLQRELCDGRIMKAPAPGFDIMQIVRQEPKCYIGWAPTRPDETGEITYSAANVCPGISVMPRQRYAKLVEEKRFDRYNSIHRGQELGSQFPVDILFSVYEPGIRLPGFIETGDMKLLEEATETGILTLYDWMDDCVEKLDLDLLYAYRAAREKQWKKEPLTEKEQDLLEFVVQKALKAMRT